MDPKKLDPQDAFDLVTRREGKEVPPPPSTKPDIEGGFGEDLRKSRPWWSKAIIASVLLFAALALVSGIVAFYWFVTQESAPTTVIKPPQKVVRGFIGEEEAKKIIEANLRAFLKAESNEARLNYIDLPRDERSSLDVYYGEREKVDSPLWKIGRMERIVSVQGEIWFVVYSDVSNAEHAVSFQRIGDDYLLHWLAMKAYGELPWEKFIVKRPSTPMLMRGYLRQYEGPVPPSINPVELGVFIYEDPGKLVNELIVIERSMPGYSAIDRLPHGVSHPVTAWLRYNKPKGGAQAMLKLTKLKYFRWQQLSDDPRIIH